MCKKWKEKQILCFPHNSTHLCKIINSKQTNKAYHKYKQKDKVTHMSVVVWDLMIRCLLGQVILFEISDLVFIFFGIKK